MGSRGQIAGPASVSAYQKRPNGNFPGMPVSKWDRDSSILAFWSSHFQGSLQDPLEFWNCLSVIRSISSASSRPQAISFQIDASPL